MQDTKLFSYLVDNEAVHGKNFVEDNLMQYGMINRYANHFNISREEVMEVFDNFIEL